jgi:hypothetical protein
VRDGVNPIELPGLVWFDSLWTEAAPFLDRNLSERAAKKGHGLVQALAEMYFTHALRANGVSLVERRESNTCDRPDLFAKEPSVWIEVVAPECGITADALENLQIDETRFLLRLTNAIDGKKNQINAHAGPTGCIQRGDAAVIAVSGAGLQAYDNLPNPPYIVQSVLGVGNQAFKLEGARLLPFVESRNQVQKINGSPVDTYPFFRDEYYQVSAVLYSRANWICRPHRPGEEFILVHNPNATRPLPKGWLPVGEEYWLEDSSLLKTKHS